MALRYYQREAVDAIMGYWGEEPGHPLVDMATGTGKSMTMATLTMELVQGYPDLRIMNVTHVKELVAGNLGELLTIWPFAPSGLFAASLGRRDARAQVLFAQLQTVWDKVHLIGHVDVLEIDEVHLVPPDASTMYRRLIDGLLAINPDMKVVGFSATLYRTGMGRLDEGDDALFSKTVYEYGLRRGIDDGYLTMITSKPVETRIDVSGVKRNKSDYMPGALAAAVKDADIFGRIVEEVMDVEGHRKSALFFCPGIENATDMRDLVRAAGRSCEVISGKTPSGERDRLIEAFKRGDIWGLSNDNVLSTGTNMPRVDLIVDTAKTLSANRYVQRVGRGTRVIWPYAFDPESTDNAGRRDAIANGPKPNCRYMDFAGNIEEHGPVDMIEPAAKRNGNGEAPIKQCPTCEEILHASVRVCSCCGHEFEFDTAPKVHRFASDAPIISSSEPDWRTVSGRNFAHHPAKEASKPPTVKTTYRMGLRTQSEWICPGHSGYAKVKADRYWRAHGGMLPFPKSVEEFLSRAGELAITAAIQLKPSGKYQEVVAWQAGLAGEATVADNDNMPATRVAGGWDVDDEIPF